ncbi:DUF4382 domain-containing protein [Pseudobacteriovorax antillogorgiicola]|uniref:DUF4382 domain-containing protein n=1 Tax=Pseudobacteriovorax antillogorgiicola TaxID=1513793 RepID=A0A1Y6BAY5_9BACT|nr:DUF4382 domain-containing protein [Pseudobacteriovorax antillogorgiicola]TCS57502.1 uncharacterized protein DUF4382 [Pseudobacteriovorax antillogorgiicola]SMF00324.1 protein of unknown function [Pseudobacteriovorax antillogorgiicola]
MAFLNLIVCFSLVSACGTYIGNPEEDDEVQNSETPDDDGTTVNTPEDPNEISDKLFTLALTDAAVDDLSAFYITVASITVKSTDEDDVSIPVSVTDEINLLDYQGSDSILFAGTDDIPYGTYSEVRLVLSTESAPRALDLEGNEVAVSAPSATSSGIKITTEFEVTESGSSLTLDFDLRKSLKVTGNTIKLSPRIRAVSTEESFEINGSSSAIVACLYEASIEPDDDTGCDQSVSSANVKSGTFEIGFVAPGSYKIRYFNSDGSTSDSSSFEVTDSNVTINQ